MKKTGMMLTIGFLLSAFSYTNAQRCGTTEYYHIRKQNDASLQSRLDYAEQLTQNWIRRQAPVTPPSLPGFIPSGDSKTDNVSYAKAKAEYLQIHPAANRASVTDPMTTEKLRLEKRKNNQFVYSKGGAK